MTILLFVVSNLAILAKLSVVPCPLGVTSDVLPGAGLDDTALTVFRVVRGSAGAQHGLEATKAAKDPIAF